MRINRILNQFFVHDIEEAIEFYEKALNKQCQSRIRYPKANLEFARVGNILIISGSDEFLNRIKDTSEIYSGYYCGV